MSYIKIGIIVNTHGLKGEAKAKNFTDEVERFEDLDYVYIDTDNGMKRFNIEKIRYAKSLAILKFEDYDSINDIEVFKGRDIYIDRSQLRELPEGTYHVFDLIGLSVNENGKFIGEIVDINQNAYQDIYIVKKEDGKMIQIPAVENFVKLIDLKKGIVEVELIEGMF
jgi:16S rRNA processing protein RimM